VWVVFMTRGLAMPGTGGHPGHVQSFKGANRGRPRLHKAPPAGGRCRPRGQKLARRQILHTYIPAWCAPAEQLRMKEEKGEAIAAAGLNGHGSPEKRPQRPWGCRQHRSERPRSKDRRRPQHCAKPRHRPLAAQRASASSLPATAHFLLGFRHASAAGVGRLPSLRVAGRRT
jgi:hypothetical protein